MFNKFVDHFKRYFLLGVFALIPAGITFLLFSYLYKRLDQGFERLLPSTFDSEAPWVNIAIVMFALYLIGVVCSYILGQRVVRPVSKKIADIFPHVQDLNKELEFAKQIHETIIPESTKTGCFDIAVDYVPCNVIGGDFVQYHFRDERKLIFIIGDVTGHGLPAALLTNRLHMEFDNQIQKGKQPGALMKAANDFILRAFKGTNMYFSAFCGLVDVETMELTYSSYGHLPQYLFRKTNASIIELSSHATMLGLMEDDSKGNLQSKQALNKGDRLILFTDGVPETLRAKKERYGTERFQTEIRKHQKLSPAAFQKAFLQDLWSFTEQEYEDDVCLMTIDIE